MNFWTNFIVLLCLLLSQAYFKESSRLSFRPKADYTHGSSVTGTLWLPVSRWVPFVNVGRHLMCFFYSRWPVPQLPEVTQKHEKGLSFSLLALIFYLEKCWLVKALYSLPVKHTVESVVECALRRQGLVRKSTSPTMRCYLEE